MIRVALYIHNKVQKQVYNINGKLCFQGIKEDGLYIQEPNTLAQIFLASTKPKIKMEFGTSEWIYMEKNKGSSVNLAVKQK